MELDGVFAGWCIDHARGELIDECGNRYTPGIIRAGRFILGCMDLRHRLIFADVGKPRRLLETTDMRDACSPLRSPPTGTTRTR